MSASDWSPERIQDYASLVASGCLRPLTEAEQKRLNDYEWLLRKWEVELQQVGTESWDSISIKEYSDLVLNSCFGDITNDELERLRVLENLRLEWVNANARNHD